VHSATKFIGGHGTVIAGIVVDGGTFDFGAHADRFPGFVEPDPSYGGLRYWSALGPGAFAAKLRVQLLRDTGPAISPFTSFLLIHARRLPGQHRAELPGPGRAAIGQPVPHPDHP